MTQATGITGVRQEAVRLYRSGLRVSEIARAVGWGTSATSSMLRAEGIEPLERTGRLRKRSGWSMAWRHDEIATIETCPNIGAAVAAYRKKFGDDDRSYRAIETKFRNLRSQAIREGRVVITLPSSAPTVGMLERHETRIHRVQGQPPGTPPLTWFAKRVTRSTAQKYRWRCGVLIKRHGLDVALTGDIVALEDIGHAGQSAERQVALRAQRHLVAYHDELTAAAKKAEATPRDK